MGALGDIAGALGSGMGTYGALLKEQEDRSYEAKKDEVLWNRQQTLEKLRAQNNKEYATHTSGLQTKENVRREGVEAGVLASSREYEEKRYGVELADKTKLEEMKIQGQKDIEQMKIDAQSAGTSLPKGFDAVYNKNLEAAIGQAPEDATFSEIAATARQMTYDAFGMRNPYSSQSGSSPEQTKEPEFDEERLKTVVRRALSGNQGAQEELAIASKNLEKLFGSERAAEILNKAKGSNSVLAANAGSGTVMAPEAGNKPNPSEFKQPYTPPKKGYNTVMSYEDLKALFNAENPKRPKGYTAKAWNAKMESWIEDQQRQQRQ